MAKQKQAENIENTTCKECRAEFRSTASESANLLFDLHDCPATPEPNKGEPFDEYQKRASAFAAEWRAGQGVK